MISRDAITSKLKNLQIQSSENEMRVVAADGQEARIAIEGSTISASVGSKAGGFQSLTATVKEKPNSDEVVVSVMTENVPGIQVKKTGSNTSNIATLTGTSAENGFLNATITTGNSKGIKETLTTVVKADKSKVNNVVQNTSPVPSKVVEAVNKPSLTTDITQKRKQVTEKQFANIGNPFSRIIETVENAVATAENPADISNPFANILATVAALVAGVGVQLKNPLSEELPSIPGSTSDRPLIDPDTGLDSQPLTRSDGSSNLSGTVKKNTRIADSIKPSAPVYNVANINPDFAGNQTKQDYVFEIVQSKEELESELRNMKRDVSTVVVDWSKDFIDTGGHIGAKHLHEIARRNTADQSFAKSTDSGIQEHYVFRRDGIIERGRPANLAPGTYGSMGENGIFVTFIAGYNVPYTRSESRDQYLSAASITDDQWKAFTLFCEAAYAHKPGIQIMSANYFYEQVGPGFDAREFVATKFNKSSVYPLTFEQHQKLSGNRLLTVREVADAVPQKIEKTATSNVNLEVNTTEELKKIENTDSKTGLVKLSPEKLADFNARMRKLEEDYENARRDYENIKSRFIKARGDYREIAATYPDNYNKRPDYIEAKARSEKERENGKQAVARNKAIRKQQSALNREANQLGYTWDSTNSQFVSKEEYMKERYE